MLQKTRIAAAAVVLTLPLAACGGDSEPQSEVSAPATSGPATPAARTTPAAEPDAGGKHPCALFTVAEISAQLGAKVRKGHPTTIQQTSSCTWMGLVGGDGAVSVVRGPGAAYAAYQPDFTGLGTPRRTELTDVGDKGHVEGVNQSDWGRWAAVAVRGDTLTIVDITGEKVSQAGAVKLLKDALARS
jgi:hypothetical protein